MKIWIFFWITSGKWNYIAYVRILNISYKDVHEKADKSAYILDARVISGSIILFDKLLSLIS
jgi:hypothetical protein